MDPYDVALAADFCKLVDTADLLEYLGLPEDCTSAEALEALGERRKHMQAMQANPKFKDSAKALIKGFATFQRVLADPAEYLTHVAKAAELTKLPMLEFAIDSVLSDGVITAAEESFVRNSALQLGISLETYERVLAERAELRGVQLGGAPQPAAPAWGGGATASVTRTLTDAEPKLQGAAGHAWWDAAFTRMLLDTIPGGPGDMVDIYCRTALSALTILPARRQLTYIGVDRSAERLDAARQALPNLSNRIALVQAEPNALPIPDASVDFVLAIRALANQPDTAPVFAEAWRVLRPGGRMIVAEPDGMAETFYFNEYLLNYNAWFHRLLEEVEGLTGEGVHPLGRPGLALGPTLHARMAAAGLRPISMNVHGSTTLKPRSFGSFVKSLRRYPEQIARSVGLEAGSTMAGVLSAVDALEARIDATTTGLGGQVLPIFLAVGVKD